MKTGRILAIWLLAVTGLVVGTWAQDSDGYPAGEAAGRSEGPQPDVARISMIHGDVSTQRGDTGDWAVTSINAPLVRGDQVATGEKSRTEVQLDYANIVRLAARSQFRIADLTRTRIQLQVAQGYASYSTFTGSEADVEIDSPNVAVRPLKPGRYRVQVNSDSETDVIVRYGEAEITTPQGSTRVKEGQMISIRGTDNPEYKIEKAPGSDDWDRWNKDRDNQLKQAEGWRRTNRYYTGAGDLDGYGHWVYVPGYGSVWQPYQQAAWAPYQSGRWVWEPYYGWTWVSYEPWGWAPYHYGRWFLYSGNWCWWPGPVYVHYRPVWSPAFVFFVGFGHHSGFGFGNIGWFPIGPHDPFYPWYGRGFNRVNVVNVTNITNITNINNRGHFIPPLAVRGRQPYYSNASLVGTNARIRGSVTTVSTGDFGRGDFRNRRFGVGEHEWHDARVMTAQVPVVPSRDNLHYRDGGSGAQGSVQPRNVDRFYTRHQPPAGPESFHDQRIRVEHVVRPEAGPAQGNMRTDVHAGPEKVERHDLGRNADINANRGNMQVPRTDGADDRGANKRRGNMEAPRVDDTDARGANGANATGRQPNVDSSRGIRSDSGNNTGNDAGKDSSPNGFRRFGNGNGPNNGGIGPNAGANPKESPARMAPGADDLAQNTTPANSAPRDNSGNSAQDNKRGDRGWSKFGPPGKSTGDSGNAGRSDQNSQPTPRSNDQGRVPRSDSTPDSRRGNDSPNWQKFPSTGQNQGNGQVEHNSQSPDRGTSPAQTPGHSDDRGGWQRFPSNSDRNSRSGSGNQGNDSAERSGGNNKQPLDLHRQVVTPKPPEPRTMPSPRSEPQYTPSPRSEPRNEPRYSPPSRSEPRYTPPPSSQRSDQPRYSPPARTESHHESHSNSSSSHGSSDRGSHNDSKSSSNPKQR
jgi:hypothetical protein